MMRFAVPPSLRFLLALALLLVGTPGQVAAQGGGQVAPRFCGKTAFANISTSVTTTTQIAPNPNQTPFTASPTVGGTAPLTGMYLCGYTLVVAGASGTAQFVYGFPTSLPGTGCGSSPVAMSPPFPVGQYQDSSSNYRGLEAPSGNIVCLTTTGASTVVQVQIFYDNNPL